MSYELCLGKTVIVRSAGGESGCIKTHLACPLRIRMPIHRAISSIMSSAAVASMILTISCSRECTVGGNCNVQHTARRGKCCNHCLLLLVTWSTYSPYKALHLEILLEQAAGPPPAILCKHLMATDRSTPCMETQKSLQVKDNNEMRDRVMCT